MSNQNERYMRAKMFLDSAIEEFVTSARSVGFDDDSIAQSILDSTYDFNEEMYAKMQKLLLPMVREFELSKSLRFDDLQKDWERALILWDQKQMWRVLNK